MNQYVKGDRELIAKFRRLAKKEGKKAIKKGTRAGCKIILAKAKSTVSVKTGATRANLKVRAMKTTKKAFGTSVSIGGSKFYQGKQFYFAFVEYGHHSGKRQGQGKFGINKHRKQNDMQQMMDKRKFIPGKHQLLHASEEAGPAALQEAIRVMMIEIEKILSA